MTSQSDIQWVDLCVFVHVTILCLSLANLSICKPPSIKHVSLPVSSPVRSSAALIPRLTVNHIDCALLISPRCLCAFGWLCICVILCLFYFLCENLVVFGGGHCAIGRFCMMYACLHLMIRTAGAFMMASQWIKLTRRFTQKRKFSWIITLFLPWNTEILKNMFILFHAMTVKRVFQALKKINVVHMIHAQYQAEMQVIIHTHRIVII